MKNKYYLLARDLNDNNIKLIKSGSIENIDKYTMDTTNNKLILDLLYDGTINSIDQDIFIVKRKGNNIEYLEPIYNNTYYKQSLEKAINKEDSGYYKIINEFIRIMKNNSIYYKYVCLNLTDIYKKFFDYFRNIELDLDLLYKQKFNDGRWALKSYPLIRNIVESFNRYSRFDNGDVINNISNYNKRIKKEREENLQAIKIVTDKDYINGQLDFFNLIRYDEIDYSEIDTLIDKLDEELFNNNSKYKYYIDSIINDLDKETVDLLHEYSKNKDENIKKRIIMKQNNKVFLLLKLYNDYINSKGDKYGYSYRKKDS